MTQTAFAEKSGCRLMEINHWVSGRRQPNVSNLARLVRVLPHARLDWLIAGETRVSRKIEICKECAHTYDDCDCREDDGTPIR